jgi:hypothetical protein
MSGPPDSTAPPSPPETEDIPFADELSDDAEGVLFDYVPPPVRFSDCAEAFRHPSQNLEQWELRRGFLESVMNALKRMRKSIVAFERRLAVRDSVTAAESTRFIRHLNDEADEAEADLTALLEEANTAIQSARRHDLRLIAGGKDEV